MERQHGYGKDFEILKVFDSSMTFVTILGLT